MKYFFDIDHNNLNFWFELTVKFKGIESNKIKGKFKIVYNNQPSAPTIEINPIKLTENTIDLNHTNQNNADGLYTKIIATRQHFIQGDDDADLNTYNTLYDLTPDTEFLTLKRRKEEKINTLMERKILTYNNNLAFIDSTRTSDNSSKIIELDFTQSSDNLSLGELFETYSSNGGDFQLYSVDFGTHNSKNYGHGIRIRNNSSSNGDFVMYISISSSSSSSNTFTCIYVKFNI